MKDFFDLDEDEGVSDYLAGLRGKRVIRIALIASGVFIVSLLIYIFL